MPAPAHPMSPRRATGTCRAIRDLRAYDQPRERLTLASPRPSDSAAPRARGARSSSAAGASRTGTWALAHGRKRPRGVVHAALSRARVQPSETLVVERKQVVTAELVRRSRLVQRGMPRRLARGWCLRARRRSPVPAGSRLTARGCFAKSSSVRGGRRWKTVTRCSPLLILYRTEGSHEALSLAA